MYIIRGVPAPLDRSITSALCACLADPTPLKWDAVFGQLRAAAQLMVPLPEYDMEDFDEAAIRATLDALLNGDQVVWAQLLDALEDGRAPDYEVFKELSPFAGLNLMFFDIAGDPADMILSMDTQTANELLRRCDVHQSPGNSGMIVVPRQALDLMRFVDCVDDIPATV